MKIHSGFTLIELMITVAVLVIVLTVAIPSFNSTIQNSRSTALANDLSGALNLARSEAVKRGAEVRVCPRNAAGTACSGTDWTAGWLVLVPGGAVLRVWDAPRGEAVIQQVPNSLTNAEVRFGPLGGLENEARTLRSRFVGCRGEQARDIAIGSAGHISVTRVACP